MLPLVRRIDAAAAAPTMLTWAVVGTAIGLWLAERAAALLLHLGWAPAQTVLAAMALGRATSDPVLSAPHHLWTAALLHADLLHLIVPLLALPAAAAAVERARGALALGLALVVLAPATVAAETWVRQLLHPGIGLPVEPGLSGVAIGLIGMLLLLAPRAQADCGLAWYGVVRVGWLPLPALPLPALAAVVMLLDVGTALLTGRMPPTPAHLAGLLVGALLGLALRRR